MIVDISHHNTISDWAKTKNLCPFIISKATQGTSFVDPYLDTFVSNCEMRDIPYWLYVYLNRGDEIAQINFMLETCKGKIGKNFVGYILDVEEENDPQSIKKALKYLEGKTSKCMIYTMYAQYNTYLDAILSRGDNTAWWEARYGKDDGIYNSAYPCHVGVDLHQYTSKVKTAFTSYNTDVNRIPPESSKSEDWFCGKEVKTTVSVKVGSARIDEHGNAYGGAAGDQTGREVATENWYYHKLGWVVLRAKDAKVAEKLASAMEKACKNSNIGYDQYQRNTLYNAVKDKGFDPSKATSKCETDCSALVRVCLAYAGINVQDFTTAGEKLVIMATGKFEQRPDKESKAEKYMKRGDILVTKSSGHTVIVLNDGSNVQSSSNNSNATKPPSQSNSAPVAATKKIVATKAAKGFNSAYGRAFTTTVNCNIRDGAGVINRSLGVLPKGTSARCYGYFTKYLGTIWYYVVASANNIQYTGFVSSKCLK